MTHYDSKYRDLDINYDKITHSTPQKSREEYSSSGSSSYVPGNLSKSTEDFISNTGQSDDVTTSGGITRNVTQTVKKTTSVSSTRSSGYSSEEGRKDEDLGNTDIFHTQAIRSSDDDILSSDKSKSNDLGFQYEDIQSFKDRQKVEGDRLQMHRQSLTGNIVGTGKYGAMGSNYSSHSSSSSSALDNNPKNDGSTFTSRIEEHKYSSDRKGSGDNLLSGQNVTSKLYSSSSSDLRSSRDDPLSRENLLAESRGQKKEAVLGSSSSSDYKVSSDRDRSRYNALTKAENLLAEARSRNRNRQPSSEFRYSRELSSSKEDLLGASKDKDVGLDRVSSRDDPLSKESITEARKQGRDVPSSVHSSSSEHRYSRGLPNSKEDLLGTSTDKVSSDRLSSSTSRDDKLGKSGEVGTPHDERYSRSDALVAKYLQSSRHKGVSKYGGDLDSSSKSHHSPLKDIKEEDSLRRDDRDLSHDKHASSEVKHHSAGGKPMSYLSSSTSYEDLLQRKRDAFAGEKGGVKKEEDKTDHAKRLSNQIREERKSRQDAINRLLESTRRFKSSESLLDTSSSRDDKLDDNLDRYRYSSVLKDRNEKTDIPRGVGRDSDAKKPMVSRYGRDSVGSTGEDQPLPPGDHPSLGDKSRYGLTSREDQVRKYTESSSYETPYTSLDHTHRPTRYTPGQPGDSHPDSSKPDAIYDKLKLGVNSGDKPSQEPVNPGSSAPDKKRGSIDGVLREPLYDHLSRRPQGSPRSPVPMTDRYSLPLDEYDKPVAVHGRPKDLTKPGKPGDGSIVSTRPDLRDYGISDFQTDSANVSETTMTSITQRTFMSRDGEVIKDETSHLENIYQGGKSAIEGSERRGSNPDLPTRIQRYPALKTSDTPKDQTTSSTENRKTTEEERTRHDRTRDERRDVPDSKLEEILRAAGVKDANSGTTKYQEQTRKDQVTRIGDDSNVRTRVHRTDVNTNVNIVKEIIKEKPKERKPKSGIAGLRSKIEALTKSVDELMNYKHTTLESYVHQHSERRPSQDILETLPKPEYYEVKSKRYEPNIKLDEVDYVHKEVEIPDSSEKPQIPHSELNIEKMWMTGDQGEDIGLRIPRQINLISEGKMDWWNAPTAEEADRFLCIGDWQWWNANTTEGVDNILGIRAINKETGEAGAIIAKYQGEEKPIEWAWYQVAQQPNLNEKRRTLTRVLTVDRDEKDGNDWWDAPTAEDADKYLSMGNHKWWDQNEEEDVDKVLGVRGATEETGTVLATYKDGTKPTAWTWVETPEEPERPDDKTHLIRRSSRDLYIDETKPENVELLIRVKDEQTTTHQEPRFVAVRPGPVEKAIIIREIQNEELPDIDNDNEVLIEGTEGEGLEIQDGVIKMRIKDMTPEERKAWVHIMGIERKGFKIDENETLEIPVRVVDKPRQESPKDEVPIYAVPDKKKKGKSQVLGRSTGNEPSGKPKTKDKKGTVSEKKKQKEMEAERKKRELKAKKLEEEKKKQFEKESLKKKKSAEKEKKKELESMRKKKEIDSLKKKKEQDSIKKKKESEKLKESKKEKKEKSTKRSGSVTSSNDKTLDGPPPIDRSLKPKLSIPNDVMEAITEKHTSNVRRTSDSVDSGMGTKFQQAGSKHLSHVEANAVHPGGPKGTQTKTVTQVTRSTYSPKKPGPFAISGKGASDRPQSARARMTPHTESHNVRTVFDKSTPTKRSSPSVKVVKRVDISQSTKARPSTPNKTDAGRRKSDGSPRKKSQIAVPLRGGPKQEGNMQVVASSQHTQSQKAPGQHIRQTRVEKTQKTYRTETKVVNPTDGHPVLAAQKSAPMDRRIGGTQTTVIRRGSGPFNAANIRRGSGHSVTNVSVKSRSSDGQPNIVQLARSGSENATALQRQGSGKSPSVTNVSVSSRSAEGQTVVRRSSDDAVTAAPLGRRRSSGHSVTNVSVSSRTPDGQNTVHKVRRSSSDVMTDPGHFGSHRGSTHSVKNVSVSSRTPDGQTTVHKVHGTGNNPVAIERQGSTRSVANVSVDGVPLSRHGHGSEVISVERHSSGGNAKSHVVNLARRPSGDPWKVDISEKPGSVQTHSKSNVSVVTTKTSSGQQAAGFPPPPDMAMLSGQQAPGFPPPPNMAMLPGQQAPGFPPPPSMAVVQRQNKPAESSREVSYYTEGRQEPHGYVKREVRHERTTQWSVDDVPP